MKIKRGAILLALSIILSLLLSCRISFNNSSDENATQVKNAIQATLEVLQTQTAAAVVQPTSTTEIQPTVTETRTGFETALPAPTVNPTPCNASRMTSESIPDGTQFDRGDVFTKTWTLRNVGTCDWNENYRLVFVSGDRMGGKSSQYLNAVIKPGDLISLSVNLTAPDEDGEYNGVWQLVSDDDEKLGSYWVTIVVGNPVGPFAVTSVSFYMPHTTIDTGCPHDINVKAEITVNKGGKVIYHWKDSAGGTSAKKSFTLDEAGSEIVEYNVAISSTGDYNAKLYIDEPNHQWFGPIEFHVNCTP